jgi:hypothetical protein
MACVFGVRVHLCVCVCAAHLSASSSFSPFSLRRLYHMLSDDSMAAMVIT